MLDDFIEAVAREAGGKDPKGLIEGLDRKEILALALASWYRGFAQSGVP